MLHPHFLKKWFPLLVAILNHQVHNLESRLPVLASPIVTLGGMLIFTLVSVFTPFSLLDLYKGKFRGGHNILLIIIKYFANCAYIL